MMTNSSGQSATPTSQGCERLEQSKAAGGQLPSVRSQPVPAAAGLALSAAPPVRACRARHGVVTPTQVLPPAGDKATEVGELRLPH